MTPDGRAAATQAYYVLGNDRVLEWLHALFRSLRRVDAGRPIHLIPFNGEMDGCAALAAEFNVDILPERVVAVWDEVGRLLRPDRPSSAPTFRKLAVFAEESRFFLFLDSDVVVLRPLDSLWDALTESRAPFLYLDEDDDQAYRPGAKASLGLPTSARGFNSGVFGGAPRVLAEADILEAAREFAAHDEHLFTSRHEQSFLNYLVHTRLPMANGFRSVNPAISGSWAGFRTTRKPDGLHICDARWRRSHPQGQAAMDLLHWAGYAQDALMPHRREWLEARYGGRTAVRQAASLASLAVSPRAIKWNASQVRRRFAGARAARR